MSRVYLYEELSGSVYKEFKTPTAPVRLTFLSYVFCPESQLMPRRLVAEHAQHTFTHYFHI